MGGELCMKKQVKRVLVMLMTLSLLLAFAAPVALATETGEGQTTQYLFGAYANNGEYISDRAADIYRSYTAKTLNWRYEAAFNTYQFRILGKHPDATGTGQNKFVANAIQFFGAEGWWYALRLESPGAGMYDVTLTNGGADTKVAIAVYFLDADEIDKALGENAVAYAEAMSADPYIAGGTEVFEAYRSAIGSMLETATPAIETNFKTESQAFRQEVTGEAAFTSDNAMVMVVKYISEGSLRLQLKSLSVTKTAELPEELQKKPEQPENDNSIWYILAGAAVVCGAAAVVVVTRKKKKAE